TAERFTFKNATAGAARAVRELADKITLMRRMRGANVVPLVKLASRPMTTRFGKKIRPFFEVVGWYEPGTGGPLVEHRPTPPALQGNAYAAAKMRTVEPVTVAEAIGDEIPF